MDSQPIPHLPPEIWLMILERLPPSFFQQDLGRLSLSKRWYSLAFPTFYPRVEFTPRVISRLVHRKSKSLDRARAQLRKTLRRVNIVLHGVGGGRPWGLPGAGISSNGLDTVTPTGTGNPDAAAAAASFNTPANLARFCLQLHEFRELHSLRFAARWQNREWRADPLQASYLCVHALDPYLSVLTNLTSLDLDLCGTDVVNPYGVPVHFCPHLRPLLSRLRTLRLRMRSICHKALWPLEGHPVTLAELSLSLYLGSVSRYNPKLNISRPCLSSDWTVVAGEMRARVRALRPRMVEPRRAEMVHLAPSGELHVWDAETDVCTRDGSVKLQRFPPCFDVDPGDPCFAEGEDCWAWDVYLKNHPDPASEEEEEDVDDLDEPDELEGLDEMEDEVVDTVDEVGMGDEEGAF